jgi:hypothetical protein
MILPDIVLNSPRGEDVKQGRRMKILLALIIGISIACSIAGAACTGGNTVAGYCISCPNGTAFGCGCSGLIAGGCPFDTCCATRYLKPVVSSSVVDFTAYPTKGVAPLAVQFYALAPGTAGTFAWDFGDGTSSSGSDPVHAYTSPGKYTVTLTFSTRTRVPPSKFSYGSSVTKKEYITVSSAAGSSGTAPVSAVGSLFVSSAAGSGQSGPQSVGYSRLSAGFSSSAMIQSVSIPAYPRFSSGSYPV